MNDCTFLMCISNVCSTDGTMRHISIIIPTRFVCKEYRETGTWAGLFEKGNKITQICGPNFGTDTMFFHDTESSMEHYVYILFSWISFYNRPPPFWTIKAPPFFGGGGSTVTDWIILPNCVKYRQDYLSDRHMCGLTRVSPCQWWIWCTGGAWGGPVCCSQGWWSAWPVCSSSASSPLSHTSAWGLCVSPSPSVSTTNCWSCCAGTPESTHSSESILIYSLFF